MVDASRSVSGFRVVVSHVSNYGRHPPHERGPVRGDPGHGAPIFVLRDASLRCRFFDSAYPIVDFVADGPLKRSAQNDTFLEGVASD